MNIPKGCSYNILETKASKPENSAEDIINTALLNPIGSPGLTMLSQTAKKILIITNDNTRPMHSAVTIPAIINNFAYSDSHYDITILIATGLHRAMTHDEIIEQFGEELYRKYRIVNHDARDNTSLVSFGIMSTCNELFLNKLVSESDLVIAEGFIEPHFFAGFSGGRKSILPGVAGEKTILKNHKPEFIANPFARQAVLLGNPIHDELIEAAKMSGLKFILNIAYNSDKQILKAFAGDPVEAHREGCRFVEEMMTISCEPADIVVTSNNGYPLDRNLYQTVKGIETASRIVKKNGVIVIAARCEDHVEHEHFKELILSCSTVSDLHEKMSLPPNDIDKWQVQILARILAGNKVILVSEGIERELAERMFFTYADTIDEAMEIALCDCGRDASICIIPDGPVIIPKSKEL